MANGNFSDREYRSLAALMINGEEARAFAKQRRLSGAIFYPTIAIATNRRLIIVNRWFLRLKSDITFIGYDNIASFRVVHGLVFSDIKIRLKGSSISAGYIFEGGREEGEIKGLPREAAYAMVKALNMALHIDYAEEHQKQDMREESESHMRIGVYTNLGRGVVLEEKRLPMHSSTNGITDSYELPQNYMVKPEDLMIFKKREGNHFRQGTSEEYALPGNYQPDPNDMMIFRRRQMHLAAGAKPRALGRPAMHDASQMRL